MRPSSVRLEHYNLTLLSITPIDGYTPNFDEGLYPKFSNADFDIGVRLGEPMEDNDDEYIIHMTLSARPKEGKPFPYTFSVGADAVLTYHGQEDEPKSREFIVVNGTSMLYSALREVLFSITTRFPSGPMMLPSANFIDLRDELLNQPIIEEKGIAPPAEVKSVRKTRAKVTKK